MYAKTFYISHMPLEYSMIPIDRLTVDTQLLFWALWQWILFFTCSCLLFYFLYRTHSIASVLSFENGTGGVGIV